MLKKLLIPLDGSAIAEEALGTAAAIARAAHAAIDLVMVHQHLRAMGVSAPSAQDVAQWRDDDKYLAAIAKELQAGAELPVTFAVPAGSPVEMICRRARDDSADLIVMTSHGRTGFSRAWLGSVADGVVKHSSVPVLMLRATEPAPRTSRTLPLVRRILVPLDGSEFSTDVLAAAADLARCGNGDILLLRVIAQVPSLVSEVPHRTNGGLIEEVEEAATRALLEEAKRDLGASARTITAAGVANVETHVLIDQRVGRAIIEFAKTHHADAIAMSTHGRGATRLLIGSVADKVLRGTELPILLRRPTGVETERGWLSVASVDEQLIGVSGEK